MTAPSPKAVFINADPVAVFAVLADLQSRDRILSRVNKVVSVSPLPVQSGTVAVETRTSPLARNRHLRIETFAPPHTLTLSRRLLGIRLQLTLHIQSKAGGTSVSLEATGNAWFLPSSATQSIANGWIREMERDLEDIRRHAEPRANPNWSPSLSGNDSPSALQ